MQQTTATILAEGYESKKEQNFQLEKKKIDKICLLFVQLRYKNCDFNPKPQFEMHSNEILFNVARTLATPTSPPTKHIRHAHGFIIFNSTHLFSEMRF